MVVAANPNVLTLPPQRKAALRRSFASFFDRGRPRVIRSYVEFATQAIRVADGKVEGDLFDLDLQPFSRVVLQEFDNPRWFRHVGIGCVQSGKTLLYVVIPAAHALFERGENFGCGVPQMEVAADKFRDEFRKTFERSFPEQMPEGMGAGSRGGNKLEAVTFRNKRTLKFLSGQGKSEKRSGVTLKDISVTEADKVDRPPIDSTDPNPIGEIEGRLASFGDEAKFRGECTITTKKGWVYREWKAGSQGEIYKPCPHCRTAVLPGRKHLVGWEDAKDEKEARQNAAWICPNCTEIIAEADRKWMNERCALVHRGQTARVGDDGALIVEGELPGTTTCGIRWSAFDNTFWSTEFIAFRNWRAANPTDEDDEESTEKWVTQYMWAEPFEPDVWEVTPLHVKEVRQRTDGKLPQRQIPLDVLQCAMGVDIGGWYGHYVLGAGRSERRICIPDYNTFDIPSSSFLPKEAVYKGLCTLHDDVIEPGFVDERGQRYMPSAVFIDSNYEQEAAFRFIRDMWAQGHRRYLPIIGRDAGRYRKPPGDDVQGGHEWYLEAIEDIFRAVINVDEYKRLVRSAVALEMGKPGSLTFFAAPPQVHTTIGKHIVSEFDVQEYKKDKGVITRHINKMRRPNHYFDALGYMFAGLNACGYQFDDSPPPAADPTSTKPPTSPLVGPDGEPFFTVNPRMFDQ